eukprot:UN09307
MKILTPDFAHGATVALIQLNEEIELLLKYDTNPNINAVIEHVLNRKDIQTEFETLFVKCELMNMIDKEIEEMFDMGIHWNKNKIIEKIYHVLMRSALNKSTYKIIRDKNYTKPFVPLRIQKKLESMNANQTNLLDPFARL